MLHDQEAKAKIGRNYVFHKPTPWPTDFRRLGDRTTTHANSVTAQNPKAA